MTDASDQPEAAAAPVKELKGRIGKYDIVRPLGKGAMGMVYLAHDTILERDVALKVMVAQIADDPELNQRFVREAKAVAKMTHPNVVNVFDLGNHTDGSPFIAMELLRGQDLQKAMRTPPPMPLEQRVSIIIQVLAGLAHAHQAGIVHRDIKPANIFLNHDGTVKIMDFGVARLTTASMTGTGNIVGTADYMSPEQVKGAKVDGRSDVFSVGCMLYELLAGKRPFHAENLMAIFYKITHEQADFSLIPKGPDYEALMPILKKALAKNLDDRYQTAYDFAVDLREYLQGHGGTLAGQHGLETIADLGPRPTSPPVPLTDASGPTLVEGDAPGGPTVGGKRPPTGTVRGPNAPTVIGGAPGTTRIGGSATVVGSPQNRAAQPTTVLRPTPRAAPPEKGTNPVIYGAIGLLFVIVLGLGWYVIQNQSTKPPQVVVVTPPTTVAPAPSTTVAVAPPVTAPPPTLGTVEGKATASIRAADAAFRQGDYDRAVAQAQTAVRDDPGNAQAQKVLDNAIKGQEATRHFQAAEQALTKGDLTTARAEADAGRAGAPWDRQGTEIVGRIQDAERVKAQAQQQAQQQQVQQKTAQVNDLIGKADQALLDQKYDVAIAFYDQALAQDPQNQRAIGGKSTAIQTRARALSESPSHPSTAGRGFVAGKTQAQSADTGTAGGIPGFEESAGVNVKKGTQAADLPGKIAIEVDPASPKAGEKYTVRISLLNEGNAPIEIKDMMIATTTNGKRQSGPVPPLVKEVAPQQKAVVRELPDNWREETTSWSMEITIHTARGETYKNQVTWR